MTDPILTTVAIDPGHAPESEWSKVTPPSPGQGSSFGAGQLIGRSFSLWGRNVLTFGPLGALCYSPMAVGIYLLYSRIPAADATHPNRPALFSFVFGMGAFGVAWLLSIVLMAFQLAAVSAGALCAIRKERVTYSGMIKAGLGRYLPSLGTMLLMGLAVLPASCLLVFPAFILLSGWCAAIPAVVAEGLSPVRALGRSWALTRGKRWAIFAGFLVVTLCVTFAAMLLQGGAMAASLLLAGPRGLGAPQMLALPMAIYQLVAGFLGTITLVAAAVAYEGLRGEKEGGDPVLLAKVFE